MSRIDYFEIETEIAEILKADATIGGVQVTVEDDLNLEVGPWVSIYLERRDPTAGQPLAAGTRTRMQLRFSIWCWQYSLDSITEACKNRDDLVGKVEVVLMANRSLNSKVNYSWLEGGEIQSARVPDTSGYVAGGEVVVIAEVMAST